MDERYSFGIEEEYFLADSSTRGTPRRTKPFHDTVQARVPAVERERRTKKERYHRLMQQMQMVARRNIVCGMHLHVEAPRPAERVDLMNRMLPYNPLLLALAASSPFWQGRDTGLAAYRLSVWSELPRTGLPDLFEDAADCDRYVAAMTRSGAIADASFL